MHASTEIGWLLLAVAVAMAGIGLWSTIRTPPQLLWGQSLIGRVNTSNNWMFNDADGSELSPAGKVLLRLVGLGLMAGAVVVFIIAVKRL